MSPTAQDFSAELDALRDELSIQGKRVRDLVESALDAFFAADDEKAQHAIDLDEQIDAADVAIEQAAVDLLGRVARDASPIADAGLRGVLNLVKINNEYERIADSGVSVAESALALSGNPARLPITARVMTNSVVGILRDVVKAYNTQDAILARLVLQSEETVSMFKAEILRSAERSVADGDMTVDLAFGLHEIASQCLLVVDHCTNVAEQVIFETTGVIVRHRAGEWIERAVRDQD
jgi:phosphate transport system protein